MAKLRLNLFQVIGKLGRDAETRYTQNGTAITTLSVAVDDSYKNTRTGEWVDQTDWVKVEVWGKEAEAASSLKKGDTVFCSGKYKVNKWQDNQGNNRYDYKMRANMVALIDETAGQQPQQQGYNQPHTGQQGPPQQYQQQMDCGPQADDDIPF